MLLFLLLIGFLLFFFLFRRWKIKRREKEYRKLKEEFEGLKPSSGEESEESSEAFEKIVEKLESAISSGQDSVDIELDDGEELRVEAPDLLSYRTPNLILHKSFDEIRFKDVERIESGYVVRFDK
ncbi:MAG: hypothetical protein ACLFUR_01405 [Candidatus Hadarchaeia archaeon]